MEIREGKSIAYYLGTHINEPVDIILKTGQSISCKIKTATSLCTHVERTDSKSFYDMIIRTDDVVAIEKKVR